MSTRGVQGEAPPLSLEDAERMRAAKAYELEDAERTIMEAETAMDVDAVVGATQRARVLRTFLARLDEQVALAREAHAHEAAASRVLGIKRAHGSLVASLDGDEQRVREKAAELADAIAKMNARYHQLVKLRVEAGALVDRFGLDGVELPRVMPPALRGIEITPAVVLSDYLRPRPTVERCEHGLRERRTYAEVRGTEGHRIIEAAGPKPWPALTAHQRRVIEQRARAAAEEQREMARMAAQVGVVQGALDAMRAASVANFA